MSRDRHTNYESLLIATGQSCDYDALLFALSQDHWARYCFTITISLAGGEFTVRYGPQCHPCDDLQGDLYQGDR